MTILRFYQPALFPPEDGPAGEIRVDLNVHLDGRRQVVHVGQRVTTFPGGELLSMGSISTALDPCDPSDALAAIAAVLRAAQGQLSPF